MSDTAPAVPITAMTKIDEAAELVREAQNKATLLSSRMRNRLDPDEVRAFESIDDRLHDALAALGQ